MSAPTEILVPAEPTLNDLEPGAMCFSASRIQTWLNCRRKAGWIYIAGYEEGGNADTDWGQRFHKYMELLKEHDGLLPDTSTDVGKLAANVLPHVAHFTHDKGMRIEGDFYLKGRHLWRGFKDLTMPGHTNDYKTTGNLAYVKTPEDLLYDAQAILYAEHAFRREPGFSAHRLQWTFGLKRSPFTVAPVVLDMSRQHAALGFEALECLADDMQAAARAAPSKEDVIGTSKYVLNVLQPNFDHCGAYRGCPFRARCPDSPMFHPKGGKTVNLAELLQQMKIAVPSLPIEATPERPTLEAPPLPIAATPAPAPAPGPVDVAALFPKVPAATPLPGGNPYNAGARTDIPAAPAISAAPATPAMPEVKGMDLPPIPTAFVNPPPKRGRGRPPGAKNKATLEREAALAAVTVPAQAVAESLEEVGTELPALAPTTAVAATAAELAALLADEEPKPIEPYQLETLIVGCNVHPFPEEAVRYDDLVAEARAAIGEEAYFRGFGYKTNGMMLETMVRILAAKRPLTIVVQDPRTAEVNALGYLRSIAQLVVDGAR